MIQRLGHLLLSTLAAALFFVAVGYAGWDCGHILTGERTWKEVYKTTGSTLLMANFASLLGALLMALIIVTSIDVNTGIVIVSAAILGMTRVFYYYKDEKIWSPLIATMAMTIAVSLAILTLVELIAGIVWSHLKHNKSSSYARRSSLTLV
ncbi:hypothetical transcript [Echinococcus multilocularis]|uniref:Hypothetical transcript n=1 Tax=Echinococcus multilocularis TaxID=6211 RepID=A0A0S4MLW1_ECHMU|nr:hypothetical transcript [Echinococcus multilocularis]